MSLTARLDLRQSQQLVMTPQLQQAIKLLQLSSLELSAFVEAELERNPLLERDEGQRDASDRLAAEDPDRHAEPAADRTEANAADLLAGDRMTGTEDAPVEADYSGD